MFFIVARRAEIRSRTRFNLTTFVLNFLFGVQPHGAGEYLFDDLVCSTVNAQHERVDVGAGNGVFLHVGVHMLPLLKCELKGIATLGLV